MTQQELEDTAEQLQTDVQALTTTFDKFIKHQLDEEAKRNSREEREAAESAAQYQRGQTFFKKHGGKLAGFAATVIAAFLAWYGNQILSVYKQQEREKHVDAQIAVNTKGISDFKEEATKELGAIKDGMVKNRILTVESVNYIGGTFKAAHPKLDEAKMPTLPDSLKEAVDKTAEDQARKELFEDG